MASRKPSSKGRLRWPKSQPKQPKPQPKQPKPQPKQPKPAPHNKTVVDSLLDSMEDGREYGSIVSLFPRNTDLVAELRRGIAAIEQVRQRPCLVYVANLAAKTMDAAIDNRDALPFDEMVCQVPASERSVDVFLVTPGGETAEVLTFVRALRPRFDHVGFILPYKAMSAGTLWALSGDEIWMDERACMGPIDPQDFTPDGKAISSQAIVILLDELQRQIDDTARQGEKVSPALVRVLDTIDKRLIGSALTAQSYVTGLAAQFLASYKFSDWTTDRASGQPVTDQMKTERADEIAGKLASHAHWRAHGHAIDRDVAWQELRIEISRPEAVPGLQRAIRRLWALFTWTFDNSPATKFILSGGYSLIREARKK